ncbi:hypothetical protein PISMIDRAFT_690287 [Pisolithus microcarpus 441]|uniref:Uncharacterized protein n=1 Tax=Pisolithus microcarpus 441 TaxID=765257 RepID=A0A0C9XGY5_9AGAM|nr:hypothetical protein PISMIDRAFT_690287 [Pisolithus microcarpus 441]
MVLKGADHHFSITPACSNPVTTATKGTSWRLLQQSESVQHKGLPHQLHAVEYEINPTMSMEGSDIVDEGLVPDISTETRYLVHGKMSLAD